MDPLSMTASIIGILQLTTTLTGYINNVRNATAEQRMVAIEASNLYGLLTSLRLRIEAVRFADPLLQQIKILGLRNGPLDQLKDTLQKMVDRIPTVSSTSMRDQIKSALRWEFTKAEIDGALKRMERLKSLITCVLTNDVLGLSQAIQGGVVNLERKTEQLQIQTERLQTHAEQELQEGLARWLGLPDPSINYYAALEKRHPETGFWLLDSQDMIEWKTSKCSFMWLHGNAGCGKTILSSALLQDIIQNKGSQPCTVIGYFYFDFNDIEKQSSKKAIRSLLFQYALQSRDCLQALEQLYLKCESGQRQPAEDTVRLLLQDAIAHTEQAYVILDALDECTDHEPFLAFIGKLTNANWQGHHIVITSRHEKDIEDHLSAITNYNINIESAVVDKDIAVYIRDRLCTDTGLKKWPPAVQEEIITVMMKKADGMFRWVYCQLESIRQCVKLSTLRRTLSSLPRTLDETYSRILQDLESAGHLQDAVQALQWLCFSIRPLDLLEIVEILALQYGNEGGFLPDERLRDPEDIMVVCSSLVSCNTKESVHEPTDDIDSNQGDVKQRCPRQIRLALFSVKEYLLSDRCTLRSDFQTQACHTVMAEGCLRYLLHICAKAPLTEEVVDQYPLARYAAKYWWQHAQKMDDMSDSAVSQLASGLLEWGSSALLSWVQLFNVDEESSEDSKNLTLTMADIAQPLYYAASIGLPELVRDILQQNIDINARGKLFGNALEAASAHGHEKVLQMLIDAGADVNTESQIFGGALQAASLYGREKVVRILLNAGANVNGEGIHGNALNNAVGVGSENSSPEAKIRVAHMLLDAGANYSTRSAALHAAAINYPDILDILLKTGVDVESRGSSPNTPLQCAVFYGCETAVQMLLNAGADPNASGGQRGSVLTSASKKGHGVIAQMLLDAGAHLEEQNYDLYCASEDGQKDTVQILLRAGANVNKGGNHYGYALQAAAAQNHEAVVQILLDAGADVNAHGGFFGHALQAASSDREPSIQLWGNPVNRTASRRRQYIDNPKNINYNDKLSIAWRNFESKLELLLSFAADIGPCGGRCGIALQESPDFTHEAITEALRDAEASASEERGFNNETQQAFLLDDVGSVVETLIKPKLRFNTQQTNKPREAKSISVECHQKIVQMMQLGHGIYQRADLAKGCEWIIQALLDTGATIQLPGGEDDAEYDHCLQMVSSKASVKIVQILLEAGADINAQGGIYGNALQAASRYSHKDIAQLLLDHGADINAQAGEYATALQAACASFCPDEELIQILLNAGADVNVEGGVYGSAIEAACYRGSANIVRILLNAGANANSQGGVYGNPLQAACASPNPQEQLVRMLLDAGAKVYAQGGKFGSAMQAILMKGYKAVVQRPADANSQFKIDE